MKPKLFIIIGTRPEIIKTFPLIKPLQAFFNVKVIFTGQHFLSIMSDEIIRDLEFPKPSHVLKISNFIHPLQISEMISKISNILIKEKPAAVLVQGDTNSTLAGALSANKLGIKLIHVEAGARCFDSSVPEEINRVLVDHMATVNFSFSSYSRDNLKRENLDNFFDFPNTVYETCEYISPRLSTRPQKNLNLQGKYVVATIHRKSNINEEKLKQLLAFFEKLASTTKIIFPVHPRTRQLLAKLKIKVSPNIILCEPFAYKDFLSMLKNAEFVISDSGGVVDECYFFNVPLFIYRNETERQDIIDVQGAVLMSPELSISKKQSIIKKFLSQKTKKHVRKYNFCTKMAKIIHREVNNG